MEATASPTESSAERRNDDRRQNQRRTHANTSSSQSLPFAILNAAFIVGLQFLVILIFCS